MDRNLRHALRQMSGAALFLSLSLAGCKQGGAPKDDASLTSAVNGKLAADTSLASEPIQVSVQQGVATLNGSVSNSAARSLAANDAALITGIRTVINNLTVEPSAPSAVASAAVPALRSPAKAGGLDRRGKPAAATQKAQAQNLQMSSVPGETGQPAPVERPTPSSMSQTSSVPAPASYRLITLPADTTLPIRINTTLDSATAQAGDPFTGSIASDVVVDGLVVLAQGTPVNGRVDTVQEAAHFKGNSLLTITLTNVTRKGDTLPLTTDQFSKAGAGRGKNSAEKIGGGAAVGAILGGILGGGKGAAIGAGVGGGAGAGVQAATKGQQVQISAETLVRFHLTSPLVVRVSTAARSRPEVQENHDLQNRGLQKDQR